MRHSAGTARQLLPFCHTRENSGASYSLFGSQYFMCVIISLILELYWGIVYCGNKKTFVFWPVDAFCMDDGPDCDPGGGARAILFTRIHASVAPKGATAPSIDKLKVKNWVRPLHPSLVGKSRAEFALQSAGASTIPLWTGSDDNYTFQMVGQDPTVRHTNPVSSIKAQLIPVQVTFYGNKTVVFDPTIKDICSPNGSPLTMVQHSPIFNNVSLPSVSASLGMAQFTSLFQRANFFKYTGRPASIRRMKFCSLRRLFPS